MAGKLYLIPVTLGGENFVDVIPAGVLTVTRELRHFIVEDLRSSRRFLRMIDRNFPIDDTIFYELNEHTREDQISEYLDPLINGSDMGIMSEAGLPGIADPGAMIVALAHRKKIRIVPMSGPSSIILSLISSGFNGQSFTFNGYLPVRPAERAAKVRDLEKKAREGYTQIFIETPYRNQKLIETLLSVLSNETMLCIAADITMPTEFIKAMKVSDWKRNPPSIDDRPAVYLIK